MSLFNYSRQVPEQWIDHLAVHKRKQMYHCFMETFTPTAHDTILDVGVTSDKQALSSNFFEQYYPYTHNIIALSNQDADFLQTTYPGLRFQLGDACHLPFADKSVDLVFSSAVIEHVGSLNRQRQMLAECNRVARKGMFITTPNRWHPVDAHTLLPLLHWLPKNLHRSLLRFLKLDFYAQEANLNLLDKKTLIQCCQALGIKNHRVTHIRTFGVISNLLLVIKKL